MIVKLTKIILVFLIFAEFLKTYDILEYIGLGTNNLSDIVLLIINKLGQTKANDIISR